MKRFASTASRRRRQMFYLQKFGFASVAAASVALVLVALGPWGSRTSSSLPGGPTTRGAPSVHAELVAGFISRPLRPLAPPAAVVAPPPAVPAPIKVPPPPDVELVATMINPGQTPSAFVRSKSLGKLITVEPGKSVNGALVKEITSGQMLLEVQGHEFVIKMGKKPS